MQAAERARPAAEPCSSNPSAASPPPLGSCSDAGPSPLATPVTARRGPAAWLRQAMRRGQAVAEERPGATDAAELDGGEPDDASYDCGASTQLDEAASFGSLPEHLLEKIFGHLRCANRKHHFAICGVNRQWRRLGQAMFFSRPWEVAHLICHPTQLFCLSPRNVTGSRSGLLKCFVRREHGPGGRRFSFCIGKDAAQPQRSRFLMAAKPGGRDTMLLYLNSRCAGQPCARLRCNLFATQYKLTLSEDLQLEPTASTADAAPSSARHGEYSQFGRLTSWSVEAAAEAAAAAQRLQQQRLAQLARSGGGGEGAGGCHDQPLEVDCFAELQYQARVKGFMQPRRMRVVLPHPSLLFYDQALPQLSRRPSEAASVLPAATPQTPPNASPCSSATLGSARHALASPGTSSSAAAAPAAPQGSLLPAGLPSVDAEGGEAAAADGGAVARWLQRVRRRRLLRPHGSRTVPVGELLQPTVLQNKAPHWNEGLRCWCLNFRGRVKLASVKNFQLVRGGDPGERVVMQFGKAEQDAFILDFNPTVLTAFQAFAIVLSTFDSKVLL